MTLDSRCARSGGTCASKQAARRVAGLRVVCLQPTVIASRASPPLLEQSSSTIRRIVDARRPSRLRVVKPLARLHFARMTARALRDATYSEACVSEASCPNFEPRAHARLTGLTRLRVVKPVRRACARGSKFGQDASLTHVASRRARAVRAKCSLAGLTRLRAPLSSLRLSRSEPGGTRQAKG